MDLKKPSQIIQSKGFLTNQRQGIFYLKTQNIKHRYYKEQRKFDFRHPMLNKYQEKSFNVHQIERCQNQKIIKRCISAHNNIFGNRSDFEYIYEFYPKIIKQHGRAVPIVKKKTKPMVKSSINTEKKAQSQVIANVNQKTNECQVGLEQIQLQNTNIQEFMIFENQNKTKSCQKQKYKLFCDLKPKEKKQFQKLTDTGKISSKINMILQTQRSQTQEIIQKQKSKKFYELQQKQVQTEIDLIIQKSNYRSNIASDQKSSLQHIPINKSSKIQKVYQEGLTRFANNRQIDKLYKTSQINALPKIKSQKF